MANETTTQIKQTYLMSNILSEWEPNSTWSDRRQSQAFAYWCKDTEGAVRPQGPELMQRRKEDAGQLSTWKLKTQKREPNKEKRSKKRTPFTKNKGTVKIFRKKPRHLPAKSANSKPGINPMRARARRDCGRI